MKENIYVPRGAKADFVLKLKGNISNHCVPNCGEKAGTYIWSNSAEIGSFERVSSMYESFEGLNISVVILSESYNQVISIMWNQ